MVEHTGEGFYESHEEYRELPPPPCFRFLFSTFLEIFHGCRDRVTYCDIDAYARLRKIEFTQYEIYLINRMADWADSEISRLRDEAEPKGDAEGTNLTDS